MPNSEPKIACAVSHTDEITLDLCLDALRTQTWSISAQTVISGITPASTAFNACLDFARSHDADLLFYVAADTIVAEFALKHLVKRLDLERHHAAVGLGYDIFNGAHTPVGVWLLNMRVIDGDLRFGDEDAMDLGFSGRVERETGTTQVRSKRGLRLAYHRPIWTPEAIYRRFRYNSVTFASNVLLRHEQFFREELRHNPGNVVLRVGYDTLLSFAEQPERRSPPNRARDTEDVERLRLTYDLDGTEYYVLHAKYKPIAQRLLASTHDCETLEERRAENNGKHRASKPVAQRQGRLRGLYDVQVRGVGRLGSLRARGTTAFVQRARAVYDKSPKPIQRMCRDARDRWRARRAGWYEHGSMYPGNRSFDDKWKRSPGRRVLLCAPKDYAGSMMKWATALHRHSSYAVRLLTFTTHQFGYELDLVVPEAVRRRRRAALDLISDADILHVKDEHLLFLDDGKGATSSVLREVLAPGRRKGIPTVFTLYGGYARKFKRSDAYRAFVLQFDRRIAMTPDLNFDWVGGSYIPHAIDAAAFQYRWRDVNRFAHSPSAKFKKGACLMLEADRVLKGREDWTVDVIEGVSHRECCSRKKMASLFFDQAGRHRVADLGIDDVIGWYGNSALEAMVFGVPTIAHLSDEAFDGARRAGKDIRDRCPVINTPPLDPAGMRRTLEWFLALPGPERATLARRTRQWIEEFHDYPIVARELEEVYDDLLGVTENKGVLRARPS